MIFIHKTATIKVKLMIGILLLLVISELILRFQYGFCDAVLMKEDPDFEYIAQPNQQRKRFGNHIIYNYYSMRSSDLDSKSMKILGFGDSVINGGVLTDQDSLATSILSDQLSTYYKKNIQFLNISAGSWGPDNCYAYLEKNGNFNAKHFTLVVSSHDAYDNMNFEKIVGINESFPNKQSILAIGELLNRYVFPRFITHKKNSSVDNLGINKKSSNSIFNPGFEAFLKYTSSHQINLIIYLHADLSELRQKKYNKQGEEIITFCKNNNIMLIKDLENGLSEDDFRDNIHLSNRGQKQMANLLFKNLSIN